MLRNSSISEAKNPSIATNTSQSSPPISYHQRKLRPSDILELKNETRAYIDDTDLHRNAEPCPKSPASPYGPRSRPNDTVPSNYMIPQKRVMQLRSLETATTASARLPQSRWNGALRPRPLKEKVIGGLSKEDQLQAIWANFDEEERRHRFRPVVQEGGHNMASGNDVLGAWEEELALHDLDYEESPW